MDMHVRIVNDTLGITSITAAPWEVDVLAMNLQHCGFSSAGSAMQLLD
jgi:hypothetical protein